MAARKKVTKGRTTKKPAAPKRAKAKAKAKPKARAKAAPKKTLRAKPKAAPKKTAKTAKTAAKKAPKKRPSAAKATKAKAAPRRDATGHLNPRYAADLRARSRESAEDLGSDGAFIRRSRAHDTLAEELGEDAVSTMTSGEDQSERMQDMEVEEETGGPFVGTSGREEFAPGTDKSNPRGSTREPFPTT